MSEFDFVIQKVEEGISKGIIPNQKDTIYQSIIVYKFLEKKNPSIIDQVFSNGNSIVDYFEKLKKIYFQLKNEVNFQNPFSLNFYFNKDEQNKRI
jgi:urate oxidase